MLGIVITGHGRLASGMLQAIEQIAGVQRQCRAVDFPEGTSTETLSVTLAQACSACDQGDGVVVLSDLLGGSPFRQSALLAERHADYEVITGTNLQLAVEMMLERDGMDAASFRDMALACGHRGLTSLWHEQQKQRAGPDQPDGI